VISILDYGLGNLGAFKTIYKRLNIQATITKDPKELLKSQGLILPGVGSFDSAMKKLKLSGLRSSLDEAVLDKNIPILGVCVGMQILADSSEEGVCEGLGYISGEVRTIDNNKEEQLDLPHMGWNKIMPTNKEDLMWSNINSLRGFYFLHSYHFVPQDDKHIFSSTFYGETFVSAVKKGNIYGFQFHPEKSHENGISLLKNFSQVS
tara:strand:+ start:647 stop:1264 length:618 start_codon:yes stop_codon:yes gene_type:complete